MEKLKKVFLWTLTIWGFGLVILSIIYLVNIPNLHKSIKENIRIEMSTYENEYNDGVKVIARYDFPYTGYDVKRIYCKIIYYSDADESLYRETIILDNTITGKVDSRTHNRDNFALEKLPVKVLIEEVDANIDKRPYFIVMAIGFIFGIIGLWKIVFAPLKETWY